MKAKKVATVILSVSIIIAMCFPTWPILAAGSHAPIADEVVYVRWVGMHTLIYFQWMPAISLALTAAATLHLLLKFSTTHRVPALFFVVAAIAATIGVILGSPWTAVNIAIVVALIACGGLSWPYVRSIPEEGEAKGGPA